MRRRSATAALLSCAISLGGAAAAGADVTRGTLDRPAPVSFFAGRLAWSAFDPARNGYVLMTNHVHLMLTPASPDGISMTMQAIGRRYVYDVNDEYERTGGLFDRRGTGHRTGCRPG